MLEMQSSLSLVQRFYAVLADVCLAVEVCRLETDRLTDVEAKFVKISRR
jgi:hypothetical protein